MTSTTRLAAVAAVVLAGACETATRPRASPAIPASPAAAPAAHPRDAMIAIEHVTLLAMTPGAAPVPDTTVLIAGPRIAAIGPARDDRLPAGAIRIDGRGRWLIPGLVDAHIHSGSAREARLLLGDPNIPDDALDDADLYLPYVAHGVLQVANLGASSEAIGVRRAIETGQLLGPHTLLAAMIDGDPPIWPIGLTRSAASPEDGRQAVRDAIAEGYDLIKVYSALPFATFTAIVDEAHRRHVQVVGHIPGRGTPVEPYFQPGFTMIAHAEELAFRARDGSDAEIARLVGAAARTGTGLITTLTVDLRILEQTRDPTTLHTRPEIRYVHPLVRRMWYQRNPYVGRATPERIAELERTIALNARIVRAFVAAGLPVAAGTDSLVSGVVPGAALHDELVALVAAGLTPYQALDAATRAPMIWMGAAGDRGTIELGKRADLVLLDGDPLADIANVRRIAGVMTSGRWLPRGDLDARLAALARRYAAAR